MIGLWFSLRTHASQIWQNPQQLLHPMEIAVHPPPNRMQSQQRLSSTGPARRPASLRHKASNITNDSDVPSRSTTPKPGASSSAERRVSYASQSIGNINGEGSYGPLLETVDHAIKDTGLRPMTLPEHMTPDDFTRAVAVATVSALRHQQAHAHSPARLRASGVESEAEGHGGHDAPSWSRTVSASVLLTCTALYALIAGMSSQMITIAF